MAKLNTHTRDIGLVNVIPIWAPFEVVHSNPM